jgi:putative CocE/NonD family hydrolase
MRHIESLPQPVEVVPHCWVPLRNGERLAARLWLPAGADRAPAPAIVEYIPYRKGDYTAVRDQMNHGYLAAHGYACVRVDVRGTGDSDGVHREQWGEEYERDAAELFAWLAAQPWCNGRIGMMGLSWGAQIGLRMAVLAPPQLKAVICVSGADDRYTNKYLGGALLLNSVTWGTTVMAQNSRPPDPANVGEGWRELWRHRLEQAPHYVENWLGHQRRDGFWESGTILPHLGRLGCPVYIVGGQSDPGYTDSIATLLEHAAMPVRALLGGWAHNYPHVAIPGPQVGFLQEARRWFDRWLKNVDTGIDAEPPLRVFVRQFTVPAGYQTERRGYWAEAAGWPPPGTETLRLHLNDGELGAEPGPERGLPVCSPQSVGLDGGEWMPWLAFGRQAELPLDQRADDGRSLCFDSPPLPAECTVLGRPLAVLEVAAERHTALLAVRLCDVAPDGTSVRVTYGVLNLTRREGLATAVPLEPGRRYRVEIPLYIAAYQFATGHRIRVSVSTAYWPIVWPLPHAGPVTVYGGASHVLLPVCTQEPEPARPFPPPESAAPLARTVLQPPANQREVRRTPATGEAILTHMDDSGLTRLEDTGLEFRALTTRRLAIRDDDPLSARVDIDWQWHYRRGTWNTGSRVELSLRCSAETFQCEGALSAFEDGHRWFHAPWRNTIARDLL